MSSIPTTFHPMLSHQRHHFSRPIFCIAIIVIATIATLWPVVKCDFTHMDDDETVAQNPHVLSGKPRRHRSHLDARCDGALRAGHLHGLVGRSAGSAGPATRLPLILSLIRRFFMRRTS